jgi:hypothetical protein
MNGLLPQVFVKFQGLKCGEKLKIWSNNFLGRFDCVVERSAKNAMI